MKKTVLIVGISSFVGSSLAEFLKKDYRVVGTYRNYYVSIPGVLSIPCDVVNKDEVQLAVYALKPDYVIYCAGLSSLTDCSESEDLADALNTVGLFNVTENCQRYKCQLIVLSSSYVFAGEDRTYVEIDIPDASTVLGKTKASAEFYIQKTSLNYLIFRCCNLYGRSINPFQFTLFEMIQRKMLLGESIACDNNVYSGYLDVYYLALIISMCIEKNVSNRLFQVSSSDYNTAFDFAKTYAKVYGESGSTISQGRWQFPYLVSATSSFTGGDLFFKLDNTNIEGFLNISLPSIEESLQFTRKRLFGEQTSVKKDKRSEGITFI